MKSFCFRFNSFVLLFALKFPKKVLSCGKTEKKTEIIFKHACFRIWAHTESFVSCQYETKIQRQKEKKLKTLVSMKIT